MAKYPRTCAHCGVKVNPKTCAIFNLTQRSIAERFNRFVCRETYIKQTEITPHYKLCADCANEAAEMIHDFCSGRDAS